MDRKTVLLLLACVGLGGAIVACDPATSSDPNPLTDNGTWIVNEQIQPGTYAVSPDAPTAYWARCSAVECNPFDPENPSVILNSIPQGREFLVIEPTDVAVQLTDVTLEGPQ